MDLWKARAGRDPAEERNTLRGEAVRERKGGKMRGGGVPTRIRSPAGAPGARRRERRGRHGVVYRLLSTRPIRRDSPISSIVIKDVTVPRCSKEIQKCKQYADGGDNCEADTSVDA